ncbi:MAG TPA: acetylglutamate kinase [Methanocella sp.]|nr:acetylglutamate kinase [Methanocella sp.]
MDSQALIRQNERWARALGGATVVVKVGGHAMVDPAARDGIVGDIVALRRLDARPVVVHGGGPEIDAMMERTGMTPRFIAGLRVTDDAALEVVRMVLAGNVNPDLVERIARHGGRGVGLLGNDGDLLVARKKPPEKVLVDGSEELVDYGWVGETERVNPALLNDLLDGGYIPVVSPIGYDREGRCLNLNADTVAGDIAAALRAHCLVSLTDVDGVMEDPKDPGTLISRLTEAECDDLIRRGVISRGMIPKVRSSIAVLKAGAESVRIVNGNVPGALLLELLTDKGIGTMLTLE